MTKIGLFGIGLDTYWDQFDGLLDRLKGYQKQIASKIEGFGAEVIDAGLVDSPLKAREAGDYLQKSDVDIVFLYVSTYALSSTVLPVVHRLNCPIIILNIQPVAAIDYENFNKLGDTVKMTGE
jgi:L-arabinose isomerase